MLLSRSSQLIKGYLGYLSLSYSHHAAFSLLVFIMFHCPLSQKKTKNGRCRLIGSGISVRGGRELFSKKGNHKVVKVIEKVETTWAGFFSS